MAYVDCIIFLYTTHWSIILKPSLIICKNWNRSIMSTLAWSFELSQTHEISVKSIVNTLTNVSINKYYNKEVLQS